MAITQKGIAELFGRENEVKQISGLIANANNGEPCLAFISGSSGTGKTAIIKNIMKSLNVEKNISIYCKFDEYNPNKPYFPFVKLIRELIRYVLSAPKDESEASKKRIKKAIGTNMGVLSSLIPELKYISDEDTIVENITLKNQRIRLEHASFQIIKEFATEDNPIIMMIDDLQWADELSLDMLEYFCCNLHDECLLLICAFRDCPRMNMLLKKVESITKKAFCFEHIQLDNFTFQQTFDFVFHYSSVAYNTNGDMDIDKIALILYKKTLGNPFYISQIKSSFESWDEKHSGDNTYINTDDIGQIITDKITILPKKVKKALICASIIGTSFSLDILSQVLCSTNDDVLLLLDQAFLLNLIIPSGTYDEFEFVHDKVREELVQMADEPERLHLIVGRELLRYYKNDLDGDRLIGIMHHFIVSAVLVSDEKEKIELAGFFATAGDTLLKASAYADAVQYFETAIRFMENKKSSVHYFLKYNSYLGYANALFLDEKYPQAEEAFEVVLSNARVEMEYIKVLQCKTILYFSVGEHKAVITTGLNALTRMGIDIPIKPSKTRLIFEMIKSMCFFRGNNIESLYNKKGNTSLKSEAILDHLIALAFSAITDNQKLFFFVILRYVTLSIKQGNTKYAPLGYAGYGIIAGGLFNDLVKARKLRYLSQERMNKYENSHLSYLLGFINALFINYWLDDWHNNLTSFDEAYISGIENGYSIYAASALSMKIFFLFSTGKNLDDLITESLKAYEQADELKTKDIALSLLGIAKVFEAIKLLKIEIFDDVNLVQQCQEKDIMTYYLIKMQIFFLSRKYEEAMKFVLESNKREKMVMGLCQHADHLFYQSLIITATFNSKARIRKTYRKILYKNLNKLQKWFDSCPANFGHKFFLISAEIARIKGKISQAADFYEKAVLSAAENGFTQNEAIASELAGKFFYSVGNWKVAETCIINAYDKYKQWGTEKKVFLLEQEYPYLMKKEEFNNIEVSEEKKECYSEKIAEALKIIIHENDTSKLFNRILDIILDIGYAERACLLTEKNDELYILFAKNGHHSTSEFTDIPLAEYGNLPQMLIYYTFNTYETIILNQNQEKGIFINDPYINKRTMSSHFCIPLIHDNMLIGILYLEKNSNTEKCSAECIEAIKVLSCQAMLLSKLEHLINVKDSKKVKSSSVIVEELTPKEKETLGLIAIGSSNKEIAEALGVSVNTVKTHVLSIYGKLNVNRRSQAAVKAKELNLVD